jgi:hypothetical protein
MNKEAQLTTMMVLSAAFALSGWALVYLSSTRGRPNRGAACPPDSVATMAECRVRPAVESPRMTRSRELRATCARAQPLGCGRRRRGALWAAPASCVSPHFCFYPVALGFHAMAHVRLVQFLRLSRIGVHQRTMAFAF